MQFSGQISQVRTSTTEVNVYPRDKPEIKFVMDEAMRLILPMLSVAVSARCAVQFVYNDYSEDSPLKVMSWFELKS